MNHSELLQYCLAKPGAEQTLHSDWQATQIKVLNVLYAMVHDLENRQVVSLKINHVLPGSLREKYHDIQPSKRLNKAQWSTVYLDGSLPDSQIYSLVDASYQQALALLPDERRQQLSD